MQMQYYLQMITAYKIIIEFLNMSKKTINIF